MNGPCEHCGNADKSKWTSQCLYKGSYPSRKAFVLSTFDAPCAGDQYDEDRREMRRRSNRDIKIMLLVAVVAIVALLILARS